MPWGRPWLSSLRGWQPRSGVGAPLTNTGTALGGGVPGSAPYDTRPVSPWAGRWQPSEEDIRQWGSVDFIRVRAGQALLDIVRVRLCQATFPVPMPVVFSIGVQDGGDPAAPWALTRVQFAIQFGVGRGSFSQNVGSSNFLPPTPILQSQQIAARSVTIDAFFNPAAPVAVDEVAHVFANVAPLV